jgi:integrase
MQNNTVTASIISRSGRKYWYIRTTFFNFKTQKNEIKEESTKVEKAEKSKKWMEQNYVPAYLSQLALYSQSQKIKNESFEYYANIFLKNYEHNHDYQNVEYRANRILGDFGKREINKITKLEIKRWLHSLTHAQSGDEISKNTKLKYLRIFRGVFELAVDDGVIERNFTREIQLEGKEERNNNAIRPFERSEVLQILEASKNPIYGDLLHNYLGIAFNQGMSPSEILGLQVRDIDFEKMQIKIERNLTKGKIKATKTAFRDRVIPLFASALPYFQALVKQAYSKKSLWLFSNENGAHLQDVKDIRGNRLIVKDNALSIET